MNVLAEDLAALGYDVIPILPGTKRPAVDAWPTVPPAEQWRGAPENSNLALRHGGDMRLASMEAERDRPEAIPALRRFLAGLGYDWQSYPANRTAHAGERYFFALHDAPNGHNRKMADDLGGGELRYGPGAFALVPPSTLADGGRYEMIGGSWDGELPKLEWADIAPLLKDARRREAPAEVVAGPLSPLAQALADGENLLPEDVRGRLHGRGGSDYPSIDDFTTVYRLAALRIDADTTLALMLTYPGYGHFADLAAKNSADAVTWLHDAYAKASAYAAQHGGDVSKRLARLIEQAEAQPWKGRTGATDKAVYLAHLRIAADANTPVWAGASRRLADMVNVSQMTATRANARLIEAGKLALHTPATAQLAAEYALPDAEKVRSVSLLYGSTEISETLRTLPAEDNQPNPTNQPQRPEPKAGRVQSPSGLGCENQKSSSPPAKAGASSHSETEKGRVQAVLAHDLFCWHGMGKAAGFVYAALLDKPGTVAELAERSGRVVSTVRRVLSKLAAIRDDATGEQYALVEESEPGTWGIADGANMDKAARLLGVAGKGDKRKAKHEQERQRHTQALEPYKNGAPIPHPSQNRGERVTQGEVTRKARGKTSRERKQK